MDIIDSDNLPDDLPDDDRRAIMQEIKRSEEIMRRMPSLSTIRFCEDRMERHGETMTDLEEGMSSIPEELERDAALGKVPDLGEPFAKYHRRLFIALNWRNN